MRRTGEILAAWAIAVAGLFIAALIFSSMAQAQSNGTPADNFIKPSLPVATSVIKTSFSDGVSVFIGGASGSAAATYSTPVAGFSSTPTWTDISSGLPGNAREHVRLFGLRPYDGKIIGCFEHTDGSGNAFIDGWGTFNGTTWTPETYDASGGAISANSLACKQFAYATNGDVYVTTLTGPGDIYKWDHSDGKWKMGKANPFSNFFSCGGCGGEYWIADFLNSAVETLAWGGEGDAAGTGGGSIFGYGGTALASATAVTPISGRSQNIFCGASDGTTFLICMLDASGNPLQYTTLPLGGSWTKSNATAPAFASARRVAFVPHAGLWIAAFQGSSITGPLRYSADHINWTSFSSTFATADTSNIRDMSIDPTTGAIAVFDNGNIYFNAGGWITPTSAAITPNPASTTIGTTVQMTNTATWADSSTTNVTAASTWSSSSPGVATVNASTGLVTPVAVGSTTISAVYGGITSTRTFSVTGITASISPASVSFGNQNNNTTSAAQTFTVTNTSSTSSLIIGAAAVTFTTGTQYALGTDSCSSHTVAASATCTFTVTFTPTTAGVKNDTINLASNSATTPDTASVSGTGVGVSAAAQSTVTKGATTIKGNAVKK